MLNLENLLQGLYVLKDKLNIFPKKSGQIIVTDKEELFADINDTTRIKLGYSCGEIDDKFSENNSEHNLLINDISDKLENIKSTIANIEVGVPEPENLISSDVDNNITKGSDNRLYVPKQNNASFVISDENPGGFYSMWLQPRGKMSLSEIIGGSINHYVINLSGTQLGDVAPSDIEKVWLKERNW